MSEESVLPLVEKMNPSAPVVYLAAGIPVGVSTRLFVQDFVQKFPETLESAAAERSEIAEKLSTEFANIDEVFPP